MVGFHSEKGGQRSAFSFSFPLKGSWKVVFFFSPFALQEMFFFRPSPLVQLRWDGWPTSVILSSGVLFLLPPFCRFADPRCFFFSFSGSPAPFLFFICFFSPHKQRQGIWSFFEDPTAHYYLPPPGEVMNPLVFLPFFVSLRVSFAVLFLYREEQGGFRHRDWILSSFPLSLDVLSVGPR